MKTFAKLLLFFVTLSMVFCSTSKREEEEEFYKSLDDINAIGHEVEKWLDNEPIRESKLKDLKKRAVSAYLAKIKE